LTNIDILELTQLPEHLMIIGGSYIGLGQMFRRFGSKVTIIERGDRLISKEDDNVSDAVADIMQSEAVELKFNAKEINVSQDNGISIKINGVDKEIKGSHYYSL
jgi:pyruvate/2-oxoglutarate dehydrogenase complex dihydrolipoamide dehydrogenase (E3) component